MLTNNKTLIAIAAAFAAVAVLATTACTPTSAPVRDRTRPVPSAQGITGTWAQQWDAVVDPSTRAYALTYLFGPARLLPADFDYNRLVDGRATPRCAQAALSGALWLIRLANDKSLQGHDLGFMAKVSFTATFKAAGAYGAPYRRVAGQLVDAAVRAGVTTSYRSTARSELGAIRITCGI